MKTKIMLLLLSITLSIEALSQPKKLTLEQFGAKGNAVALSDGSISSGSTTLNCGSANFSSADVGKIIFVAEAVRTPVSNTLIATIKAVNSPTSVTLDKPATVSISNTGVTYGTDCTDAFVKFNKEARVLKDVVLNLQAGNTYLTAFNNYLTGIKSVTVHGNGANIICTHGAYDANNWIRANVGLFMPSCWDNVDNNYYTGNQLGNVSYGYRIQTAQSSSTYVQTMSAADAASFKPGNWVMVYGLHHEDFGGWPPDPTFFEYEKVTRVDYASGKIYLDRPLRDSYDAGWPEGKQKGGVGAARVINLDRDNFTTVENLEIDDLNFVPFNCWTGKFANNQRNSRFELYGFIYGKISNVNAAAAYFGQGKKLVVDRTTITGGCEPDKGLDTCIVTNSKLTQLINAGGLHYFYLLNNTLYGGTNASPRNLFVSGNTFVGTRGTTSQSLAAFGFNKGTDYIEIGPNTWDCSNGQRAFLMSPPSSVTLTVGTVVGGDTFIVPYNSFLSAHDSRRVVPGALGYTTSGKSIKVLRVFQYDADNIGISGQFDKGSPSAGDAFVFQMAPKIVITGKQTKIGGSAPKYTLFQTTPATTKLSFKDERFKN